MGLFSSFIAKTADFKMPAKKDAGGFIVAAGGSIDVVGGFIYAAGGFIGAAAFLKFLLGVYYCWTGNLLLLWNSLTWGGSGRYEGVKRKGCAGRWVGDRHKCKPGMGGVPAPIM